MPPVAGVDDVHMGRHVARNEVRRARFAVAHHENISRHGAEVGNGVEQRFALGGRGARNVEVEHVGAQALGGNLERGAGARAVFEKQVEHALAAQQGHFLDFARIDADKL